ncbi:MAG: hypothetical protein ABSF95_14765 [Verrucomicrobiota bacterium]
MSERERLQLAYELAFYPPRLNEFWGRLRRGAVADLEEAGALLDQARLLHQALPEGGYASQRALNRLALYQAKARAFGMVAFLDNLRRYLKRPPMPPGVVPPHLVRDIGLPPLCRAVESRPAKRI